MLYSSIINGISKRLTTLITLVKYWPHIKNKRFVVFGGGVIFRAFRYSGRSLLVHFSGKNHIGDGVVFQGGGKISFGRNSFCGSNCVFGCNQQITIGENVMIADASSLRDSDHVFENIDVPMIRQGVVASPIVIEDDVWIGHGVTILKGITIGRGSIVAAGSVVTKDIPPLSIMGGVPAKLIKSRV